MRHRLSQTYIVLGPFLCYEGVTAVAVAGRSRYEKVVALDFRMKLSLSHFVRLLLVSATSLLDASYLTYLPLCSASAELSMLLNPGREGGPATSARRGSGDFTGLVRHVIELAAVGEVPVAVNIDINASGTVGGDEPLGCAISYTLPSDQVTPWLRAVVVEEEDLLVCRKL